MPGSFLIGRSPTGNAIPVKVNANGELVADIGTATLNVTADGVEVKNDAGNPIPASIASLPLPAGAATAAKQPALGTAGSPSTDVITVQGAATGTALPVSGTITAVGAQVVVSASFTRPANTTAYAANGAVSDSTTAATTLTFASSARVSGGSGLILSARHVKNSTTTANATFRLWLYRATVSAVNDGSQFPLLFANRNNRIGFIDFSHTTAGTGSDASSSLVTFVNLPFVATGTSLFGQLIATAAYVPTSGEQHYLELEIAQN